MVRATYNEELNQLSFQSLESDEDFGVFDLEIGTVEVVEMRDYNHLLRIQEGGTLAPLGLDCSDACLEYDEWFRMDMKINDGTAKGLFHRTRSYLRKVSNETSAIFTQDVVEGIA